MTLPGPPPLHLRDGDLELRPFGDGDGWLEQALSAESDVVRWTMYPDGMSAEVSAERLRLYAAAYAALRVARYVLEVAGEPVGIAGVGGRDDGGAEVFYAVLPRGRGRGAATRAARLLAAWAHGAGATVELSTHDDNAVSRHVAAAAGFVRYGEETRDVKGVPAHLLLWRWEPNLSA